MVGDTGLETAQFSEGTVSRSSWAASCVRSLVSRAPRWMNDLEREWEALVRPSADVGDTSDTISAPRACNSALAAAAIVDAAVDIFNKLDISDIWLTLRRRRL